MDGTRLGCRRDNGFLRGRVAEAFTWTDAQALAFLRTFES